MQASTARRSAASLLTRFAGAPSCVRVRAKGPMFRMLSRAMSFSFQDSAWEQTVAVSLSIHNRRNRYLHHRQKNIVPGLQFGPGNNYIDYGSRCSIQLSYTGAI